jgi:RNA polymerase I-specific transcription initiation factor RRN3
MQQKAPAASRTHSETYPSKSASATAILRRSNTAAICLQPDEAGNPHKEKPGSISIGTRRIATNSRIKKDEQNKRDMYLAFINNALKAKSEVRRYQV